MFQHRNTTERARAGARGLARRALVAVGVGILAVGFAIGSYSAPAAHAAGPTALILSTTVTDPSGPGTSVEQTYLQSQGYTVNEVGPTAWSGMSKADFASYQLIVFGDPTCSADPSTLSAAVANESTWAPTINGNSIVIGTDPVYHNGIAPVPTGPLTLIQKGLDFAGAQPGKTGLYLDLSCYYNNGLSGQHAPILDGIESGFVISSNVDCADNIDVVATNPYLSGLTNADLSGWDCSVHEFASSWPSDFVPIAIDTNAPTPAYTAPDGSKGDPYILGRGAGLAAGNISLTPASGSAGVGTNYTLTAFVQSGGSPVAGATVTFTATSGPNAGKTLNGTTNASGDATATYSSTVTGTDTWTASFVDSTSHTETSNNATVEWKVLTAPTTLTVSAATGDHGDATNVSATLTRTGGGAPVAGATVTFSLNGTETCSGTTDASGVATCSVTPGENAGTYPLTASFAGTSTDLASTGSGTFTVTHEETALAYTGSTTGINGQQLTLSGTLTTDDPATGTALTGRSVTFTVGTGATAQSCSGTTDASGAASCTISSLNQAIGTQSTLASFAGDAAYLPASDTAPLTVFPPSGLGAFVIGDGSATGTVNFWGSQWAKNNSLSNGSAPNSMKGFAATTPSLSCGSTWSTTPGDSSAPPESLPGTIAVIVSSHITKNGSVISGDIEHILVVKVNPGYAPEPGHAGWGTVIGKLC